MATDIQLVVPTPMELEAVHITPDLLYDFARAKEVVDWCHARYVQSTKRGTFIELVEDWTYDSVDIQVSYGWIIKLPNLKFMWVDSDVFPLQFEMAHDVVVIGYPQAIGSAAEHSRVADLPPSDSTSI